VVTFDEQDWSLSNERQHRLHHPDRSDVDLHPAADGRRALVTDSLVYRYNPEASPDGLRGSEGTFSLCTFAYIDALARAGRLDDAQLIFEKMLTYANHLGLYSEEIALTGEQIGNFPQAFTHLAMIDAAVTLNTKLDLAATRAAKPSTSIFTARRRPQQNRPHPSQPPSRPADRPTAAFDAWRGPAGRAGSGQCVCGSSLATA
jgi:hypothetical protein